MKVATRLPCRGASPGPREARHKYLTAPQRAWAAHRGIQRLAGTIPGDGCPHPTPIGSAMRPVLRDHAETRRIASAPPMSALARRRGGITAGRAPTTHKWFIPATHVAYRPVWPTYGPPRRQRRRGFRHRTGASRTSTRRHSSKTPVRPRLARVGSGASRVTWPVSGSINTGISAAFIAPKRLTGRNKFICKTTMRAYLYAHCCARAAPRRNARPVWLQLAD